MLRLSGRSGKPKTCARTRTSGRQRPSGSVQCNPNGSRRRIGTEARQRLPLKRRLALNSKPKRSSNVPPRRNNSSAPKPRCSSGLKRSPKLRRNNVPKPRLKHSPKRKHRPKHNSVLPRKPLRAGRKVARKAMHRAIAATDVGSVTSRMRRVQSCSNRAISFFSRYRAVRC